MNAAVSSLRGISGIRIWAVGASMRTDIIHQLLFLQIKIARNTQCLLLIPRA